MAPLRVHYRTFAHRRLAIGCRVPLDVRHETD
jgi:hypothetical protein